MQPYASRGTWIAPKRKQTHAEALAIVRKHLKRDYLGYELSEALRILTE